MNRSVQIAGTVLALRAELWTPEQFATAKGAWDSLLAASDADPLFMSWDWQWRWWQYHARVLRATLRLVALYSDTALVGLAPLYSHTVTVRGILRPCRLEFIGSTWRDGRTAFSDYLDIISARPFTAAVRDRVTVWLEAEQFWDDLVLCCIRRDALASSLVPRLRATAYVRELEWMNAWSLRLPSSFNQFIERLPSDMRRKLFNHRAKFGPFELHYAGPEDVPSFLVELWSHAAVRWGFRTPNKESDQFHIDFARAMAFTGRLRLSRLGVRGSTASLMYNVQMGDTLYYLQSAFDATRTRGMSPGYMHFGYAIEAACEEQAARFEFLAGSGRHRDYKRDLLTQAVPVTTYHIVRRRLARSLYAAYEALTGHREPPGAVDGRDHCISHYLTPMQGQ